MIRRSSAFRQRELLTIKRLSAILKIFAGVPAATHADKDGRPMLPDEGLMRRASPRYFWFAQMTPRVTANWSLSLGGRRRSHAPDLDRTCAILVTAARERKGAGAGERLAGSCRCSDRRSAVT